MEKQTHTRASYMAKECTHSQYFGQFVTSGILSLVRSFIGEKDIRASTHEVFNDIPLAKWDVLHNAINQNINVRLYNDMQWPHYPGSRYLMSMSETCCTAKEAARMIRDNEV